MGRRLNKTKEIVDCGIPLSEQMLENYSGGFVPVVNDLSRLKIRCSIEGCNFECNTFGEMNLHMQQAHPERC